ncbi:S-layer homology domain-containing protein [Paenibacillus sp. OV219]|uniref:S-layer homology domain-containing protein n=1 Tax=Paenibacillus sp. OV219 TaxID=1884377 RepID=UPI0008D40B00|nr:S-layer homology domain-containing protein [Paenibacillus sp. OV219]SEP13833.1 S-layer homology domain-containing protein [Paenibacillus sp. OV219]
MRKKLIALIAGAALLTSAAPLSAQSLPNVIPAPVDPQLTLVDITNKHVGESITIAGTSSYADVVVKIIAPDDTVLYLDDLAVTNARFSKAITLLSSAALGTYTVVVGQGTDVATDQFKVLANTGGSGAGGGGGGGGGGGTSGGTSGETGGSGSTEQPGSAITSIPGVINQGQAQVLISPESKVDGNTVTVTIEDKDLTDAITGAGQSPVAIVISKSTTEGQQAQFMLSPSQLQALQGANEATTIVVSTQGASLALPVSVLKQVPAGSSLKIVLKEASESNSTFMIADAGITVIGTPVSFEVFVVTGSQSVPITLQGQDFVKRSFIVSGDLNPASAGVLYLENGEVEPVPATFTHNSDGTYTVVVNRPGFSVYAAASHKVAFNDIGTSYANNQIQTLASKFLLNGTSATSFSPKKHVTRAEFAAMLVRALGLTPTGQAPFHDVPSTAWYAKDVAAVQEAGLVNGYGDGSFHPNADISRQELAVILSKVLKLLDVTGIEGPKHVTYGDAQSFAGFAEASILAVTESGLMKGQIVAGQQMFNPSGATTREAAAMVLYALLQKAHLIN